MTLKIGSLFSGYGGLDMATEHVTGATPAWFVEFDGAPSKILAHHWPDVPNYGDVTKIDWATVPPVDIITGGSPCQDLSAAGRRAGMTEGTHSNLWVNMREAIAHLKPQLVVWENVQGALSAKATSDSDMEPGSGSLGDGGGGHLRALGRVLGDFTEIGYDCQWATLRASDIGAPHHRARVFLIAWPQVPHPEGIRRDNGQATNDWQADREVHSPRHDSDAAADSERDDGGTWSSLRSGREATFGTYATSGSEHSCGAGDKNFTDTSSNPGRISDGNGEPAFSGPCSKRRGEGTQQPVAGPAGLPTVVGREPSTADTHSLGSQEGHVCPIGSCEEIPVTDGGGEILPDTDGIRRDGRGPAPLEATGENTATHRHSVGIEWGEYAPAIRRWERIVGPAPSPTEPNTKGKPRLNATFAEWMMGLPAGHVTGVPGLSRADQLKAIGNGVCPQQAIEALTQLLKETL